MYLPGIVMLRLAFRTASNKFYHIPTGMRTEKEASYMEYKLIRSARKTLALEVRGQDVIVRAPDRYPQSRIDAFVSDHEDWLREKLAENIEKDRVAEQLGAISAEELEALADKACEYIPQRVALYAKSIGVTYGRITIRCQRTKWGSCSAQGNLNFNCLLMLTPPEVIDSIVVHELCHRRQMNHSRRFYDEVQRAYPEYDKWHRWLKDNGGAIMARVKWIG